MKLKRIAVTGVILCMALGGNPPAQAQFAVIDEAGHHPELEQPRAFVDEVARFLRQSP